MIRNLKYSLVIGEIKCWANFMAAPPPGLGLIIIESAVVQLADWSIAAYKSVRNIGTGLVEVMWCYVNANTSDQLVSMIIISALTNRFEFRPRAPSCCGYRVYTILRAFVKHILFLGVARNTLPVCCAHVVIIVILLFVNSIWMDRNARDNCRFIIAGDKIRS